jgi:hypothetical protein
MDVEILWKLLTRLAERDDDADCVPHIVLIAEDARVILAEVSRLRQDLSTAIERAAKVAEEHSGLSGAYGGEVWIANRIASSIRSLKTENSK